MRRILLACIPIALTAFAGCGGDDDGGGGDGGAQDGAPRADGPVSGDDAGPPVTVTLTTVVGDRPTPFAFVAGQDGDGPWQALSGADGVYTLEVTSGRYAVAVACDLASYNRLEVVYATVAEAPELTRGCVGIGNGAGDLDVRVTNFDAGGSAVLSCATIGNDTVTAGPGSNTAHFSPDVGTYDVIGTGRTSAGVIDKIFVRRDLAVSGGATTSISVNLGTGATVPLPQSITVNDGDVLQTDVRLHSLHGTVASLINDAATGYAGMPAARLDPAEMHEALVRNNVTDRWTVKHYFHAPVDVTVNAPPPIALPALETTATDPYVRHTVTQDAVAGARLYEVYVSQAAPQRQVTWLATAGWLGNHASYTWTLPDFTGLEGWVDSFALAPGVEGLLFARAAITDGNLIDAMPIWDGRMPEPTRADQDGLVIALPEVQGSFTP